MLTIEKTVLPTNEQWEIIIEGMRNPMNSWDKMDSVFLPYDDFRMGENDHKLMMSLANGGAVHAKYRRMIPVWVTINAPLYWWKEADTYTTGKVQNSCSTMHKIHTKKFSINDFSCEHLIDCEIDEKNPFQVLLFDVIDCLNEAREAYLETKDKKYWWQMIQLLPTSYNQKRTVMLNYEVLAKMYRERRHHKLDEWHTLCDWIKTLPYSDIILVEEE